MVFPGESANARVLGFIFNTLVQDKATRDRLRHFGAQGADVGGPGLAVERGQLAGVVAVPGAAAGEHFVQRHAQTIEVAPRSGRQGGR